MLQIDDRRLFVTSLAELINCHSLETDSDTPDFILAEYMTRSLEAFNNTIVKREEWYGRMVMNPTTAENCRAECDGVCCCKVLGHKGHHQGITGGGRKMILWES